MAANILTALKAAEATYLLCFVSNVSFGNRLFHFFIIYSLKSQAKLLHVRTMYYYRS